MPGGFLCCTTPSGFGPEDSRQREVVIQKSRKVSRSTLRISLPVWERIQHPDHRKHGFSTTPGIATPMNHPALSLTLNGRRILRSIPDKSRQFSSAIVRITTQTGILLRIEGSVGLLFPAPAPLGSGPVPVPVPRWSFAVDFTPIQLPTPQGIGEASSHNIRYDRSRHGFACNGSRRAGFPAGSKFSGPCDVGKSSSSSGAFAEKCDSRSQQSSSSYSPHAASSPPSPLKIP